MHLPRFLSFLPLRHHDHPRDPSQVNKPIRAQRALWEQEGHSRGVSQGCFHVSLTAVSGPAGNMGRCNSTGVFTCLQNKATGRERRGDILLRSPSEEPEGLHHPSTITADFRGIPSFPGEMLHVALSW